MPGVKFGGLRAANQPREVRPPEAGGKGPGVGDKSTGVGFPGYKSHHFLKASRFSR